MMPVLVVIVMVMVPVVPVSVVNVVKGKVMLVMLESFVKALGMVMGAVRRLSM